VKPSRPRLVDPALAEFLPFTKAVQVVPVVLGVLTALAIVVQAIAMATAINRSLLHHASLSAVRVQLIAMVAAVIARAILGLTGDLVAHRTADTVVSTLQGKLLRHSLSLGPSWLAGERPGELSLTATRGLRSLHSYFSRYLPQAAVAVVVPVILLVWIATQDWLSLVVVVALVIAVPLTMIYFGREATKRTARQWRRLGSLAGRFLQLIEGLPTLRAFGRDAYGRREVMESSEGVRVATMRTLRVAFLSALALDMIAGFGVGFVAMALGLRLLWGALSFQTAMAVLLVAPEIFVPMRRAGAEFHASTEGQAAATRVLQVLNTPLVGIPATTSTVAVAPAGHDAVPAPSSIAPTTPPELRIAHLRVGYENRSSPALDDFSLRAESGSRIALVGPSGAGKSTVLAALLSFTETASGTMALGQHDMGALGIDGWRAHFSWLPQRPYLFAASLADNLRLGAPSASEASLSRAINDVGLGELVAHLPRGLETVLGPDGLSMSFGERQRVALARALLRPAPILLLDEPTASLDSPTVTRMSAAIEPWLTGRTVIVAAHEPALLSRFDAIVEIGADVPAAVHP
jgi:thiol reductant ABC exporter CydD subunit